MSELERRKEELIEFLDVLRRGGFKISTEQYVSAHHLLCTMAAHADWPDPRGFGLMLAPLLCSTREEQDSFPHHYQQWLNTRPALFRRDAKRETFPTPDPEPIDRLDGKGLPSRQLWFKWWKEHSVLGSAALVSFMVLITVAFYFILFKPSSSMNPPVVTPTPTPDNTKVSDLLLARFSGILTWVSLTLGGVAILMFVTRKVLRYTRQLGLKKWRARENQLALHLNVIGASEQLLRSLPLRRVAQEMRRYRPFDETDLDVPKTIEETIRAGVFTPAFSVRKALPEYLVLIDRAGSADQQAQLVESIVNQLARNDVPIERYFFQEDPRICRKDGPKVQLQTLEELALQYPRHFLLVFSDGTGFFNPLTGRPYRWLESFASWNTRLLLTSEVQTGDYRDWVLNELGFRILPAGKAGLAAISGSLEGSTPQQRSAGDWRNTPLPPLLHERPSHWLKSHPPRAELIVELCHQLKDFLGDDGYYWLSACAVYPLLYLDLTFYLGERLTPHDDLFETYSKLVRLPWFRSGSMPDWLRAYLIMELDETKDFAIRTAVQDLLIGSLKHPEGFLLPIVTEPKPDTEDESGFFRRSWAKLTGKVRALDRKQLAEDILKSQPDDSRLRDHVAVTFMSGRKPSKLAVKVPRELHPVLYPSGPPAIDRLTGRITLVITLLASFFLLLPVFSGNLAVIVASFLVWAFFMGLNVWAVRELTSGDPVPHTDAAQESDGPASDVDTKANVTTEAEETEISGAVNALHQIPSPPIDFTGREDELKELLASIEIGGVTIPGLWGMAGIGKTALAFKLVELLKPRYPDAQFYLDLKGTSTQPLTVAEALAHVVRAYLPMARLPDSESELRGLYLSVLDGQRALLLMDNAVNAKQVEPLIPPAGCLLLVTSRQHFTVPGLAAKNLDTLSAANARDLLLTIAPRIGTHAEEIAELCGYLPLALRLAAAVMVKYRNLSPADYVRRLRDRQQRLQLIDASLSLSYELLSEELRERWRWLAVFPDTFADYSAAAVWEVEADQAKYTLGELMAASLVDWNVTSDRNRLHDLARLFADAKLSAEERAVGQKRFATHYKNVLAAAGELYLEGGESLSRGLALFDLEWDNIQAGHAWVAAQADAADADVARLAMTYPDAGVYVLDLRQHSRERIRWLEIALVAASRLRDQKGEGHTLVNLGIAYADLGESRRAIQFYEQALPILREIGDRTGEGYARGNLGIAYKNLGEPRRAIQFYEQKLEIVREVGDRRGEGNTLTHLGNAYADLREIDRAIQFHEQALLIVREIGDRRGEGNALASLGLAYANLGETRRAIQFDEQALLIVREIGDRRGEGITLYNMSLVLDQYGDRAQAIQHAEQALTIFEQIEDPNAAKVRARLAAWSGQTNT